MDLAAVVNSSTAEGGIREFDAELLAGTLNSIEAIIRDRHSQELAADCRTFIHTLKKGLSARLGEAQRGRKRSEKLDTAERLRAEGKTWDQIAAVIEPEYRMWDHYRRKRYRERLQAGVRARNKRRSVNVTQNKNSD